MIHSTFHIMLSIVLTEGWYDWKLHLNLWNDSLRNGTKFLAIFCRYATLHSSNLQLELVPLRSWRNWNALWNVERVFEHHWTWKRGVVSDHVWCRDAAASWIEKRTLECVIINDLFHGMDVGAMMPTRHKQSLQYYPHHL